MGEDDGVARARIRSINRLASAALNTPRKAARKTAVTAL
jgi:hypothetical protein